MSDDSSKHDGFSEEELWVNQVSGEGGASPSPTPAISTPGLIAVPDPSLRVVDGVDLPGIQAPHRPRLVDPILRSKDLVELYGPRGVGKTFFSLGLALSLATARDFLIWRIPRAVKVLYVDGEMQLDDLWQRIRSLCPMDILEKGYFRLLSADLQADPIPSLATSKGQEAVDQHIGDASVIFLDNLASLMSGIEENDAKSWDPMQAWLLRLRREGRSVFFVHHASKYGGGPRGTSHREDVLDTVIYLEHPKDYDPEDGARFTISFKKNRAFYGRDAMQLEVALEKGPDGQLVWTRAETQDEMILRLHKDKLTNRLIGEAVGLSESAISRRLKNLI